MKINYYPETDSLYIDLSHRTSVDSREVSDGVVLDYDEAGNLVGIDIDQASLKLNMGEVVLVHLPSDHSGSRLTVGMEFLGVSP